jgi:hypothetical protein
LVDKHSAVSQDLVRFAEVIAHIAAFAHDRVDEEIPTCREDVSQRRQPMAAESLKGMACDRFADMAAKQQTGEKPAEILRVVVDRKVDPQLFGIEPALFQPGKVGS